MTRKSVTILTFVALAGFLFFGTIQRLDDAKLKAGHGNGIVDYELAFTMENCKDVLYHWSESQLETARHALIWDFPFIPSYVFLIIGISLLTGFFQDPTSWYGSKYKLWIGMTATAGLFDMIENFCLFRNLTGALISNGAILGAGIFASLKFLLLLIVIVVTIFWAARNFLKKGN